jgi:hypothetical protein
MAKGDNPFARAVSAKSDARTDAKSESVREAGADLRRRQSDEDLDQPTKEGGDGNDVPSSVAANPDAGKKAENQLGLGAPDFVSAKDRVGGRELAPDADLSDDSIQMPEERINEAKASRPGIVEGASTQDALAAASGDDNTDVGNLALNPRDLLDQAKAGRNALNDPLTAALTGLIDEQANSAASSPLSVADGATNTLGAATNAAANMTEKEKEEFAKSLGVTPASPSATPAPTPAPATEPEPDDDDDEGGIVDTVVSFLKGLAGKPPEGGGRIEQELEGTDAGGAVGTVPLGVAQEKAGIPNLESEIGKVAGGLAGGKKGSGAAGSGAGGGAKLTDPDDDRSPPTEAEIAFRKAIENELGVRRIPGDIDPGDGDTTSGGTPVSAGDAHAIVEAKGKNSLVGNPGSQDAGQQAPKGVQGEPGLGGTRHGGDIDFEDGSGFTGGTRTTGPGDVDFGVGQDPLIGINRNDDDDEDEDESDDEGDDKSDDGGE